MNKLDHDVIEFVIKKQIKESLVIVTPISWTKYNWKDLWGFYYEIKFTVL